MRKLFILLLVLCLLIGIMLLASGGKDSNSSSGPNSSSETSNTSSNWETKVEVPLEDGKYKVEIYSKDNNRLVEENYYDAQGNSEYRVYYEYNDAGQLTNLSWYSNDMGISAGGYYEYDYDESGKLVQKRVLNANQNTEAIYDYNADGTTDITTYPRGEFPTFTNTTADDVTHIVTHLDASGKKVSADGYSEQYGHLTHTEYNDDGSGTTWSYYMWDDAPEGTVDYVTTFDAKEQFLQEKYYHQITGSLISITDGVFDGNGVLIGKICHEYYADGSLSSETEYNINSVALWYKDYIYGVLRISVVNTFDETTGWMTESVEKDADGNVNELIKYEYYDNGVCRSEMHYDGEDNFLYGYAYTEDGVGEYIPPNW